MRDGHPLRPAGATLLITTLLATLAPGVVRGMPSPAEREETFIRVGEKEVTREEYAAYLLEKFGRRALDRFVTDLLVREEAARRGVQVTEEKKAAWVERTLRENREDPDFFPWLKAQGLTLESYEQEMLPVEAETQVCLEEMVRADRATDAGIRRAYEERYGVRYGVKVILVRDDLALQREAEARALDRLREARGRLEKGEPFGALAREYSESPDAEVGGDLGFVSRGRLDPAIERAIFSMEPGQVTGPVESEFGYHLVQAVDRRGEEVRARHILIRSYRVLMRLPDGIATVEKHLHASRRSAILESAESRANRMLEDLRVGADFSTVAAEESSHPSARKGGEIPAFRPGAGPLPPAVEEAVTKLEVDALAGPIEGDLGYYIVRLVSREGEEKAFTEVKDALQEEALSGPVPPAAISLLLRDLREGVEVIAPSLGRE